MIISIITIIFILEISIFFAMSKRVEYYSPVLFFVALPVFYANSLFLDHVISNRGLLELTSMAPTLSVDSSTYLVIVLFTFLFTIGVYSAYLAKSRRFNAFCMQRKTQILEFDLQNNYSWLKLLTIFLCLFYIVLLIYQIYGLGRNDIKALSSPVRSILSSSTFIFLCFSLMYRWRFKALNTLILVTLLTYSILSFERENILLVIFALVVNRPPLRLSAFHMFAGLFLFGLMVYYKALVWSVIGFINGQGMDQIMSNLSSKGVRLTHVDPAASLLMLADFIDNDSVFIDYYGSYFVNTIMQILRMISDVHWASLGEFSTQYYTNGKMGTAFSMIIESILNFSYVGPLVIGFVITYVFFKTEKINSIYYKLHYFIWFLFMLKFVRTELAVVLKLYILPAIIAYLLFVYVTKKSRSIVR
jgi:hypothetical protein